MKQDHSIIDAPDNHWGKRACSRTEEANETRSSKTVPASIHSFDQPESKPIKPPSSPAKNDDVPNDGMAVEASASTAGHEIDSTVGISESNTDQSGDESESD